MFYWVVKAILTPILRTLFRPWVEGADTIPAEGAAVLASNHLSSRHPSLWPAQTPRPVFTTSPRPTTGSGPESMIRH